MLQKRPRYAKTAAAEKQPPRITSKDIEIFKLFGPGKFKRFNYLTAELITVLTGRRLSRVQERLRDLSDNGDEAKNYLQSYDPPHEQVGGSQKRVYRLYKQGAAELRTHYLTELDRQLVAGKITLEEANRRARSIKKIQPIKNFDPNAYHQKMDHHLTTNLFRVLVIKACEQHPDIKLLYQYPDRFINLTFEYVDEDQEDIVIVPDTFFGWGVPAAPSVRNFTTEIYMPSRKAKESSDFQLRDLKKKLANLYAFRTHRLFELIPDDVYPQVRDWHDLRSLNVTNTGEREHQNIIELTRNKVCLNGKGLRQFWFARITDFDIWQPESLFAPVWYTAVPGDRPRSLLE